MRQSSVQQSSVQQSSVQQELNPAPFLPDAGHASPRNDKIMSAWLILCIFWFPKCDAVHSLNVVLKMLYMFENESLGLANRMATGYPLACWDTLQVALNMVHHFVRSGVSPRLVLIGASIVPDAYDALGLLTDKGERVLKETLLLSIRLPAKPLGLAVSANANRFSE